MMTREEFRKKLISEMKTDPPATASHYTQWCKRYKYIDIIKYYTSYLPDSCKFSERIYHLVHNLTERPKCKYCKAKFTKFTNNQLGYQEYCSKKCAFDSPDRAEKIKDNWTNKTPEEKQEHVEKIEQGTLKKHGVENPFQLVDRVKAGMFEKHGAENAMHVDQFKDKLEQTCLERFGETTNLKTEDTKQKIVQTRLDKYGKDHHMKTDEYREKFRRKELKRMFDKLLNSDRLKDHYEPLFTLDEYVGVNDHYVDKKNSSRKNLYYSWLCKKCGTEFLDDINCGNLPRCPICYPGNISDGERELDKFCRKYYPSLALNTRSVIKPYELDIYIPEINLAVEYNGVYWHSELFKDKLFHQEKLKLCHQKDVRLIQIFEDEWLEKQFVVESLLLDRFNMNQWEIPAENCDVAYIEPDEALDFHYENSLATDIPLDSYSVGLAYDSELVAVLTVGRPRLESDNKYDWEVFRYSGKVYTKVSNGLKKLISYITKPTSIVTYIDVRYSLGEEFKQAGFNFLNITEPRVYKELNNNNRVWNAGYVKYELII